MGRGRTTLEAAPLSPWPQPKTLFQAPTSSYYVVLFEPPSLSMKNLALRSLTLRSLTLLAALACGACAYINDKAVRLVSTKVNAYAVLDNQLLAGEVLLSPDRSGRVNLSNAAVHCLGAMRHTASKSGSIDLSCSQASSVQLQYVLLTETRGYAYGNLANGNRVSMAFGLGAAEASSYLRLPAGKQWNINEDEDTLEIQ